MTEWLTRPLDRVYPVIFIDAMVVKVRDGQVMNKPVYVVIGVTVNGERDILGLWAGDGGEGAKFWLSVFCEIKNRGVDDVCIAVCDGLKGLPEAIDGVPVKGPRSISVGAARLAEQQAAAATRADNTLARARIANSGEVLSVSPDLARHGWWVVVTRERTVGDGEYEGLASGVHVTLVQLASVGDGWAVSQWLPQS